MQSVRGFITLIRRKEAYYAFVFLVPKPPLFPGRKAARLSSWGRNKFMNRHSCDHSISLDLNIHLSSIIPTDTRLPPTSKAENNIPASAPNINYWKSFLLLPSARRQVEPSSVYVAPPNWLKPSHKAGLITGWMFYERRLSSRLVFDHFSPNCAGPFMRSRSGTNLESLSEVSERIRGVSEAHT